VVVLQVMALLKIPVQEQVVRVITVEMDMLLIQIMLAVVVVEQEQWASKGLTNRAVMVERVLHLQ
tara:strand:+ start:404 stop:598 length:195 start_codon:yes stop_codon:yes gene_type:complete